jgi:hypothetical protein
MNRLTVIAVAVAVVVTITVTTLLSRSTAGSLPVPHIPAATAGHHATSGSKTGGGGGPDSGPSGGSSYVSGPAPTLSGCSVSVSDSSPLRSQTAETVTVTSTPDVQVSVVAVYAHTRSRHGGVTNSAGVISLTLPVSHAPVGVTVGVTATASLRGQHVTCFTSFTPVL